jgi:hypothetical protein
MGQWGLFVGAGDRPGQYSYCRRSVDAPPIREMALERDEDLLLKEPHHYKNKPPLCVLFKVRSRSCLAMSESYIHIINQKPVWKVRFPKSPGGVQDFEVRQPEMG